MVKILQELVLNGFYTPGQRIREEDIIEKYGVSRTPIREAFVSLEHEGLIEIKAHRGVFVAAYTKEEIRDILRIEGVLEGLAAFLAVGNISEKELVALEGDTQKAENSLKKRFNPEEFYHEISFFTITGGNAVTFPPREIFHNLPATAVFQTETDLPA